MVGATLAVALSGGASQVRAYGGDPCGRPGSIMRENFSGTLRSQSLNVRVKSVILGVLLCLALGATIVAAVTTFKAIQQFRQERALTASGDVSTIRPWMTVPFIAHVYHVPE